MTGLGLTMRVRRRQRNSRRFFPFLLVAAIAALYCATTHAQQKSPASSDLARQNRDQVSAPPAIQIKAILMEDPGLMVTIKQWVAQDATDHGQILSEDDLTDAAILIDLKMTYIFARWQRDLFRQFGFRCRRLIPEFGPGQAGNLDYCREQAEAARPAARSISANSNSVPPGRLAPHRVNPRWRRCVVLKLKVPAQHLKE